MAILICLVITKGICNARIIPYYYQIIFSRISLISSFCIYHLLYVRLTVIKSLIRNKCIAQPYISFICKWLYFQSTTFFGFVNIQNIQNIRISAENSANTQRIFIVGSFAPRWRRFISASLRSSNLTARRLSGYARFIDVQMFKSMPFLLNYVGRWHRGNEESLCISCFS